MKILVLSSLMLFSFCKKWEPYQPEPHPESELNIIWKVALTTDTGYSPSIDPVLHDNLVLISSQESVEEDYVIKAFDKNNGELIWSWDDLGARIIRTGEKYGIIGNTFIMGASYDAYTIDLTSGNTIWGTQNEHSTIGITVSEPYIFSAEAYVSTSTPFYDSSKIKICDYSSGNWEDIFTISRINNFNPHIQPPAIYINANGETLLIFQNRGAVISTFYEDRVDLYCYNLDQDSIVWHKPDFTPSGSSNIRRPIIEGDRAYFGGKWDFYCIDIPSGNVIWTHHFYHDYQGSNFVIYNNTIITNLDNGDLIAINKSTGTQKWVNEGLSGCCTELRIYGDRIYFGTSKMHIVRAFNGQELYEFDSPTNGGTFHAAIAVDLENNRMYTTDGYYLMCMELPE